ncbi:hypothetical protein GCM10012287_48470 [Streptomyces daqingensis]|uniref:Uncharacterized protein n=1 Tax=Streptomyces daqingensis TaxID=1472640 RepID=A0ABQ2MQI0_9ACTN|nr:hypothetical protein GCM10012287_48470 [Streptomyces daqingensis]
MQRVTEAVPQGEEFVAAFQSEPASVDGKQPIAPKEHRPQVFVGMNRPSDSWGTVFSVLGRLLTNDLFNYSAPMNSDAGQREKCRQEGAAFFGDWTSNAGELLAALQPQSRTGVISMLTVTTHRARVIYIQRRRGSMYRLRDGTELGWSWPLDQLAWVRQRAGKNVQFGFPDGSWASVVAHTADDLQRYFPHMLPKAADIPR